MSYTRTIVCLANSRKPPSGRCVAGRAVGPGGFGRWVRPVSARPTREVSLEERRYADGRDPKVLDLVTIGLVAPAPDRHQRENHLMDADFCWRRVGRLTWDQLQDAVEALTGPLWRLGHSSVHGVNDRAPESEIGAVTRSLQLLGPLPVRLCVRAEGGGPAPPRRRVRARFIHARHEYALCVTDPIVEGAFLRRPDGEYKLEKAVLCLSLSELFHGYAYKLVASVITPRRVEANR